MTRFLSQRPNLDPEPWVTPQGVRSPFPIHGRSTFKPRPEFEQTKDPLPFLNRITGNRYPDIESAAYITGQRTPGDLYSWSPRRDQYDTPVNRVLESFRANDQNPDPAEYARLLRSYGTTNFWHDGANAPEIAHAIRVLERLANLSKVG